jgi:hypothetical protein
MSNSKLKPQGDVRAVSLIPDVPKNKVAVSATVVCEDDAGNKFSFRATYFVSDIRPYNPEQEMEFFDWDRKRSKYIDSHKNRWRASDKEHDREYRQNLYLEGKAFDDVPELKTEW